MRFRKFDIPDAHPWVYPSRYPYFTLEGRGRTLSEEEKLQIEQSREAWFPSKVASDLFQLLKSILGKTVLVQIQNPGNYYDSPDELPKVFVAELKDAVIEKVLDVDKEFEQLFILLSHPRHKNGESIFEEYNYDYQTLLQLLNDKDYKLNFGSVIGLSVEQPSFWKRFFKNKNGS